MRTVLPFPTRDTARRSHHPILAVCAVLLGPFIVGFHSRLFGIGLVDLRGAFGLGVDEAAWLNTLSTAPQIILAPCVPWLAITFGVRRVTVIPGLLFAGLSLVIPFVHDFSALLILHVMHGLLLGLFVPATLIIIFRNLPVKWWITGVAVYAFRSAFTANAGISLLDFYVQHLGWQFCYWQDVLLAPIMAFLAFFGTPHEHIDREKVRTADWGGMLLLGFGLAFIFVGVDQGNRLDWLQNGTVVSFLVGGTTLIVAFLVNEAVVKNPWASIDVIGARNLLLLLTLALLYLITGLSNTSLIPNYLISVSGLRPEQIGAVLAVWCCIPLLIMTPLVAWGLHLVDGRWLLLIGLCCFAGAAILGTGLTAEWSGDTFRMICVLQGVGHILTFLPIIVLVLANGNPQRAASLAAYIQVIRLLGNEMAQAMMTTFLRKREQLHSFLIGLDVQKGDALTSSALSATTKKLAPFSDALSQSRATTLLAQQVSKQANVLAYIDGFWLTFIAAVVGLLVLALVTRAPKGPMAAS